MVRAKMKCQSVKKFEGGEVVELQAVNGKNGTANATWSKYTPSGSVTLSIDNPEAQGHFRPGGYYFVDFSETDENG